MAKVEVKPYYLSYWRQSEEGYWTSCEKEFATRMDVVVRNGQYSIEFPFALHEEREMFQARDLMRALEYAMKYGEQRRSRDIRDALQRLEVLP